jgi:hypothetical protein
MGSYEPKTVKETQPSRVILVTRRERLEGRTCAVCGRTFVGRSTQRYCSRPCQQRADYERHADARRAARRERHQHQKTPAGEHR